MTILTGLSISKPQDSVELPRSYTLNGKSVRFMVYFGYILTMLIAGVTLYLNPTQLVLTGFLLVHVTMLVSLLLLVRLVLVSQESDLVYDSNEGLRWTEKRNSDCDHLQATVVEKNDRLSNEYLSYTFI